jgi:hypothetical protein
MDGAGLGGTGVVGSGAVEGGVGPELCGKPFVPGLCGKPFVPRCFPDASQVPTNVSRCPSRVVGPEAKPDPACVICKICIMYKLGVSYTYCFLTIYAIYVSCICIFI